MAWRARARNEANESLADPLTIDSASTCHIEVDLRKIAQWVKPNTDPTITVSGLDKNVQYTVTHYGDAPSYSKVYVVPQSDGILASVDQLTKNKYKLLFDEHQVIIMHPEQENVYGTRNEYDHYTIDRHHIKVLQQKKTTQSKSFMIGSEEGSNHSRATNT
jgi:hypothetical protein